MMYLPTTTIQNVTPMLREDRMMMMMKKIRMAVILREMKVQATKLQHMIQMMRRQKIFYILLASTSKESIVNISFESMGAAHHITLSSSHTAIAI
eukprot:4869363-Ditylum_brightwellii.AAC.1